MTEPAPEREAGAAQTALLRFLARLVQAEGQIKPEEMAALLEISTQLEVDGDEASRLVAEEADRPSDVAALAAGMPDPEMRTEGFALGCVTSCAAGDATHAERTLLMEFARGAGIPADEAAAILDQLVAATSAGR
jgi:uncharacterized membrane protein YebE (DUF533 family)